jgi:hypothetical protein
LFSRVRASTSSAESRGAWAVKVAAENKKANENHRRRAAKVKFGSEKKIMGNYMDI